ncbi:MAG: tRNA-dihydrouridine synthase, partial [Evtepia sp.]|nr:tRNA-dihydrouridine synthase [Evtepia sp.]
AISIKTRIGMEDAAEWPALLAIFRRYPIRELIIHPRLRRDFYRGPVHQGAFQYAVDHCDLPLCYNGDLFTPQACRELAAQFPSVSHWMAGRGLVYNPALGRQLQGGEPLTPEELRAFHDQLVEAYRQVLSGDRPVLGKMKELWFYWSRHFLQPEGPLKRIRKAKTLLEYRDGVNALFRDCPFQEEGPVTF